MEELKSIFEEGFKNSSNLSVKVIDVMLPEPLNKLIDRMYGRFEFTIADIAEPILAEAGVIPQGYYVIHSEYIPHWNPESSIWDYEYKAIIADYNNYIKY